MRFLRSKVSMSAARKRRPHVYLQSRACRALHTLSSVPVSAPFNILFLGRDEFSVLVLEQLYQQRDVWSEITVATQPDYKTGRNASRVAVSPLKIKCLELGVETHHIPRDKSAFKNWLPPSQFLDMPPSSNNLLVTASFGRMIHDRFLDFFPVSRRLNVHPSLVPLYRGPAPIQHTIADGQEESGVCILEMKEKRYGADGGEVWARKSIPVPPKSDFSGLRNTLGVEGGRLLASVLRDMIAGTATAAPQDDTKATRAPFITQGSASVDFHTWDAGRVERVYRAISQQKPIFTTTPSGKTLQLHSPQSYVHSQQSTDLPKPLKALHAPGIATYDPTTRMLAVRCANDTYLYIPTVKQEGKLTTSSKQWWAGLKPEWISARVIKLGA
ncbi:Formyltransferase [Phellopilus nigrolimitatus]|nr:Formyltransferase [Phellopilus nigrolimitatus]